MMETHTGFGGWQGAPQGFGGQGFGQQFGPTPGARLGEFAGQGGDIADLVRTLVAQRLQTGGGRALNFDIGDLVRAIVAIRMQTGEPLIGGPGPDIGDIVRLVVGARLRGGMGGQSDVGDLVRGVIGARIQAGGPLLGGESDVGELVRTVVGARLQSGGPLLDIGDLVKAIVLTHAIQARTGGGQAFGQGGGQGFGQHMGGFGYTH
ncbi:hypothetical protein [Caulobacter sp. 17J65-9]|uniref:hypothetical protein n=1 Tax=Caulobacter sp. 17J65-9 TaxID=2709382 RepID=UPI0013C88AEF|nr:hypothetical protein [Caulobacter sp. 17J65-9]NEX91975.1 hypothetical protein [Caulobacter sp. 17J65-9]